ncbi:MAG TPA: hypothetical protein VNR39_13345 [Pseudolabrys sp.]|nr:hypothetical protein [Pseudolabrys sp.]
MPLIQLVKLADFVSSIRRFEAESKAALAREIERSKNVHAEMTKHKWKVRVRILCAPHFHSSQGIIRSEARTSVVHTQAYNNF